MLVNFRSESHWAKLITVYAPIHADPPAEAGPAAKKRQLMDLGELLGVPAEPNRTKNERFQIFWATGKIDVTFGKGTRLLC